MLVLAFSRRVFSLPRAELWRIFAIDTVRLVVSNATLGIAWAFAMPSVSVGMWLFLVAARLLVSRLPLVPDKDLLFANFAILVIGQDATLSNLVAFSAASILLLHVLIIVGFGLADGIERMKEWRRSSPHLA
ncbi:hypothetical protein AB5I41_18265 [Sphingomonas sp. MMS24-JH45]